MMKFIERKDRDALERDEILKVVALAFEEWKEKEAFFETVDDQNLVDYAIYQMEASRLKYIYLLNKLRKEEEEEEEEIHNEKEGSLNHG